MPQVASAINVTKPSSHQIVVSEPVHTTNKHACKQEYTPRIVHKLHVLIYGPAWLVTETMDLLMNLEVLPPQ